MFVVDGYDVSSIIIIIIIIIIFVDHCA